MLVRFVWDISVQFCDCILYILAIQAIEPLLNYIEENMVKLGKTLLTPLFLRSAGFSVTAFPLSSSLTPPLSFPLHLLLAYPPLHSLTSPTLFLSLLFENHSVLAVVIFNLSWSTVELLKIRHLYLFGTFIYSAPLFIRHPLRDLLL